MAKEVQNENTNGLLREFFPKKTDLAKVNQSNLNHALGLQLIIDQESV